MDLSYGYYSIDKMIPLMYFGSPTEKGFIKESYKDNTDLRFINKRRWEIDMKK